MKVLDAVSLEERFKAALPMLTRQIEGLKLLKKSKKLSPDSEKRVPEFFHFSPSSMGWIYSTVNGGVCRSRSGVIVA